MARDALQWRGAVGSVRAVVLVQNGIGHMRNILDKGHVPEAENRPTYVFRMEDVGAVIVY
jgi:hypothetical protein